MAKCVDYYIYTQRASRLLYIVFINKFCQLILNSYLCISKGNVQFVSQGRILTFVSCLL